MKQRYVCEPLKPLIMKTLFATLFLLPFLGWSQTNLSGGIYNSETWNAAGSPYIISGNLVIFDGVHITIEENTEIRFNAGASIELRGTMEANGTSSNEIIFTSNETNPGMGDWDGIKVIGTTDPLGQGDQLTMRYVNVSYAEVFVDLDIAYHGPYIFENCIFEHMARVNEDGGMPVTRFTDCTFRNNIQALDWCQFGGEAIRCTFKDNQIGVIGISLVDKCYFTGHSNYASSAYGITTNSLFENNNVAVKANYNAVNHTFQDNTVKNNNIGIEVSSFFNGSHTVTGNTFCNNSQFDLRLLTSNNADWSDNCWCGRSDQDISNKIFDGYDNVSYGLVTFNPQATWCNEQFASIDPVPNADLNIVMYPNPFEEGITIEHKQMEGQLEIYDQSGGIVLRQELDAHAQETQLELSDMQSGVYHVRITSNETVWNSKLVKM